MNNVTEWKLRARFEFLRHANLVWAVCSNPKCKRGSWWSKLPAKCAANGCGGEVKRP
jgi:hypothetical protein